jgi:nitrous-oxide reductase
VDAETMEVRWQVLLDGNCDLVATSYDGKLAASNQYNTEGGAKYEDMMSAERDACVFFNIARIEEAVKAGKFKTIGTPRCRWWTARASQQGPKTALTAYVSVPKNPHGVNASPDAKYFICAGKLSPTGTVIELAKVLDWFDGKMEKLDDAIVAEVELGLGPLHTAFDGRGNAYTTLFLDSQIVKWNVEKAIAFHKGDKTAKYVVDRLDVHYQPGHINASQRNQGGRRQVPGGGLQVLQGPLPAGRPAAPRERADDRHLGREDGAAGRPPGARRAARLHHLQARAAQAPSRSTNWTTSPTR